MPLGPLTRTTCTRRHAWLVGKRDSLQTRLEGDPSYYDARIAGWWVWGLACWIGSEFCSGKGPWHRERNATGDWVLTKGAEPGDGVHRNRMHLGNAGLGVTAQGVNRNRMHLGNAGLGVNRKLVHLGDAGRGVNRQLVHLRNASRGVNLLDWFEELADRLTRVRVCCGDWTRVCGSTPTIKQGLTAVFLDPPYANTADRQSNLYLVDSDSVAHDVREWALEHGDDPLLRIALCGYEGEHKMPRSWTCVPWKAEGGYGSQGAGRGLANAHRERIWFSPHCLKVKAAAAARPTRKVVCCG